MTRRRSSFFDHFFLFGVFVAVVAIGLFYGLVMALLPGSPGASVTESAPTIEAYHSQVSTITLPFFAAVDAATKQQITSGDPALISLTADTKQKLLAVRVPADARNTDLALVLLLDQWSRALAGSKTDQLTVQERTHEFEGANPWLHG